MKVQKYNCTFGVGGTEKTIRNVNEVKYSDWDNSLSFLNQDDEIVGKAFGISYYLITESDNA